MIQVVSGRRQGRRARDERGQVLVISCLALVVTVAMPGLVIDGGSTFVQRRDQQNVADAAAMAAGYAYSMTGSTSAAAAAGQAIAASNGYTTGAGGVAIAMSNAAGNPGWNFTAVVTAPHNNHFTGLIGMPSWNVTTTATAISGRRSAASGAMPIIFNQRAFDTNGAGQSASAEAIYDEPDPGNQDVPLTSNKFNWTMYCDTCNADSNTVRGIIDSGGLTAEADLSWKLSPLNAGSHDTLYSS